jgi:tRNA threonylcarbamoyl adenosine modification protein (Sua5/YciO/YrdC/YwlC family)
VAIPTDTAYALVCLPTHEAALGALADLRGQDRDQPVPVFIDSVAGVIEFMEDPGVLDAYVRFWPGALTLIVRSRPGGAGELVAPVVSDGLTIGVRKPDDRLARAVIRASGGLLAATSAGRAGEPPCASAEGVAAEFGDALLVLDGGPRDASEATVLDITGVTPRLIREGAIPAAALGLAP